MNRVLTFGYNKDNYIEVAGFVMRHMNDNNCFTLGLGTDMLLFQTFLGHIQREMKLFYLDLGVHPLDEMKERFLNPENGLTQEHIASIKETFSKYDEYMADVNGRRDFNGADYFFEVDRMVIVLPI